MLSFSIADDFDKYTSMKSMTCISDEGKVNTVTLKDDYLIIGNDLVFQIDGKKVIQNAKNRNQYIIKALMEIFIDFGNQEMISTFMGMPFKSHCY